MKREAGRLSQEEKSPSGTISISLLLALFSPCHLAEGPNSPPPYQLRATENRLPARLWPVFFLGAGNSSKLRNCLLEVVNHAIRLRPEAV